MRRTSSTAVRDAASILAYNYEYQNVFRTDETYSLLTWISKLQLADSNRATNDGGRRMEKRTTVQISSTSVRILDRMAGKLTEKGSG
jgi:hypothetical protein